MKTNLEFDYEFVFDKMFDVNIYNQCTLPDTNNIRQNIIVDKVSTIRTILNDLPGLHQFSTFTNIDTIRYKITITR